MCRIIDSQSQDDINVLLKMVRDDNNSNRLVFTVDYDDTMAEKTNTFSSRIMLWQHLGKTAAVYVLTSRSKDHINLTPSIVVNYTEYDSISQWCDRNNIQLRGIVCNSETKADVIKCMRNCTPNYVCHFDDDIYVIQECVKQNIPVMYPAEMLCDDHRTKWVDWLCETGTYEDYVKNAPHKLCNIDT